MLQNLATVVTKENLVKALDQASDNSTTFFPSRKFDIIYNGKTFPPKEIVRRAARIQGIKDLSAYSLVGGEPTNKSLRDLGFEISSKPVSSDPIAMLIEQYKKRIAKTKLIGELYKWKLLKDYNGRPNLNAQNFTDEISTINFANLIYPVGIGVVRDIAKQKPEQYRNCFKILFGDPASLEIRIKEFSDAVLTIYRQMGVEERFSHHHDERTCATFLTYHNPNIYAFYKDSFYQKYCKLIGEVPKKKGEKYAHYLKLVDELIENYITDDRELLDQVAQLLPEISFEDKEHKLLAQDVLYQTLDISEAATKKYWRIGTTDKDGSYWELMKNKSYVSIGWSDLGDLSDADFENKSGIIELLTEAGYYDGDARTTSRKAGEIFDFIKTIKKGDIILAQEGTKVLGIGIMAEDYAFAENENFPHYRLVQWKVIEPGDFFSDEGKLTTVYQIKDATTIMKTEELLNSTIPLSSMNTTSKNIILFGPPGTGKTYNTIDLSVKIVDGISLESHNANKERFDQLAKEGRIEFVTFHQNYSYEDFLVGISPDLAAGHLRFKSKEGVFKKICEKAKINYFTAVGSMSPFLPFETIFYSFFTDLIQEEVKEVIIPMRAKNYNFKITAINEEDGRLQFTKQGGGNGNDLLIKNIKGIYEGTLDYPSQGLGVYYYPLVESLREAAKDFAKNTNSAPALQNYVLILDEINRANISRVFGELITLLEEDKRIGQANELRITLPNGEKDFGVPPNLYIIGTMNTADKSIALVDIALRRRFEFIGYYPKYNLPELDSSKTMLLQQLNKAIYSKKHSADYLIGHAYFIPKNPIDAVIKSKIIPLLMEYFAGKTDIVSEIFAETEWEITYDKNTYSWIVRTKA